jgi:hypothetical protein
MDRVSGKMNKTWLPGSDDVRKSLNLKDIPKRDAGTDFSIQPGFDKMPPEF